MNTQNDVKREETKKLPKPATQQAPKIRAVYDSAARKLHGAHGIGCRN